MGSLLNWFLENCIWCDCLSLTITFIGALRVLTCHIRRSSQVVSLRFASVGSGWDGSEEIIIVFLQKIKFTGHKFPDVRWTHWQGVRLLLFQLVSVRCLLWRHYQLLALLFILIVKDNTLLRVGIPESFGYLAFDLSALFVLLPLTFLATGSGLSRVLACNLANANARRINWF